MLCAILFRAFEPHSIIIMAISRGAVMRWGVSLHVWEHPQAGSVWAGFFV